MDQMKKIYRKLFELFSWLGWVTGYKSFQLWAGKFYIRCTTVMDENFQPVGAEKEKETKDLIIHILDQASVRMDNATFIRLDDDDEFPF
jgi:hypothetical protein